jgi:hypothetical protein
MIPFSLREKARMRGYKSRGRCIDPLGNCSLRCSRLWLLLRSTESVPGLVPPASLQSSRREREFMGQQCTDPFFVYSDKT